MLPTKKSRQPRILLSDITKQIEEEFGEIAVNDRQQPNIKVKKVFCWLALELGHNPVNVGARCGLNRASVIHHHKAMKGMIALVSTVKTMRDEAGI